jgi:hypothetical protein
MVLIGGDDGLSSPNPHPQASHTDQHLSAKQTTPFPIVTSRNPRGVEFLIYSTFQLQIEYSILSWTFETNSRASQGKLRNSNSFLILF